MNALGNRRGRAGSRACELFPDNPPKMHCPNLSGCGAWAVMTDVIALAGGSPQNPHSPNRLGYGRATLGKEIHSHVDCSRD
jgi:hypothetical protein